VNRKFFNKNRLGSRLTRRFTSSQAPVIFIPPHPELELLDAVHGRAQALAEAKQKVDEESAYRRKAELVQQVIDRVVVTYDYPHTGGGNKPKSVPVRVEIIPVIGDSFSVWLPNGTRRERGSVWKALFYAVYEGPNLHQRRAKSWEHSIKKAHTAALEAFQKRRRDRGRTGKSK